MGRGAGRGAGPLCCHCPLRLGKQSGRKKTRAVFGEEKLHNVLRKRSDGSGPAGVWLLLPKISLILDHVFISSLPSGVGWLLKIAPESRDLRFHHGFHRQLSNCFRFLDLGKMRALDHMSLVVDSLWSVNNDHLGWLPWASC